MTKQQCNCEKISSSTPTASSDSVDSTANSSSVDLQQLYDEEEIIRRKLSLRTYHLPGNNWRQDWLMYINNNHLVFGLCCHHRLHPVTTKHRLIILLGSLAFGLTVTNAVYLYYLYGDTNYDDTAFALSISLSGEVVDNLPEKNVSLDISNGMAVLWTIGASAHAMFDLLLWHMIACGYCQRRKFNHAGWNMAIAIVSIFVALASFVVLYRAYQADGAPRPDTLHLLNAEREDSRRMNELSKSEFCGSEFVLMALYWFLCVLKDPTLDFRRVMSLDWKISIPIYSMVRKQVSGKKLSKSIIKRNSMLRQVDKKTKCQWKQYHHYDSHLLTDIPSGRIQKFSTTMVGRNNDKLFASLFVFTPIIQAILFSGILGCCGKVPLVGGRPRSVALEKERVNRPSRKQMQV
ncbi:hypothetical protein HJC23_002200 [Cyclotella cryptica]|uniref:Uncharacterized protein n=1 Tax=Cyclotella cryptica TaxID=29204 RepID=A0ABD3Q7R7_9STRA